MGSAPLLGRSKDPQCRDVARGASCLVERHRIIRTAGARSRPTPRGWRSGASRSIWMRLCFARVIILSVAPQTRPLSCIREACSADRAETVVPWLVGRVFWCFLARSAAVADRALAPLHVAPSGRSLPSVQTAAPLRMRQCPVRRWRRTLWHDFQRESG